MSPRPQLGVGQYGNIHASKQGSTWVALARFRDVDGETRRVKAQGSSKSASIQALRDKLDARAARSGGDGEIDSESTVKELAEKYFAAKESEDLAPNTYYNLRRTLDNHIVKRLGGLRVREVTPPRVEGFVTSVVKSNGPGTALMVRSVLSGMFSSAARWGAVQANPVAFTTRPKLDQKKIRALSLAEVVELRSYVAKRLAPFTYEERLARANGDKARMGGKNRSPVLLDVMDFLLATGCRAAEPAGLMWDDVHLDDPVPWVEIKRQVQRHPGSGLVVTPTKERDERRLVLPRFAVEMLRRRQVTASGDMVFLSERGTLLASRQIATAWSKAVEGSGFEWVTLKTLRKTVATLVADEHGSAFAAQQLGHTSDKMTRQFYIAPSLVPVDAGPTLNFFEQPPALEA